MLFVVGHGPSAHGHMWPLTASHANSSGHAALFLGDPLTSSSVSVGALCSEAFMKGRGQGPQAEPSGYTWSRD